MRNLQVLVYNYFFSINDIRDNGPTKKYNNTHINGLLSFLSATL